MIGVVSAEEMFNTVHRYYADADIVIGAAAVADYRPKFISDQKIKKDDDNDMVIALERTKDILISLGEIK